MKIIQKIHAFPICSDSSLSLCPYLKWNVCSMWNVCVRERVAVVAVRMPLEVCPGIRKTEQRRGQRMPNHFETSMQNTQLAEPTQPSFVEKTGPSTLPSRMPHMPRHLLNTILIPYNIPLLICH